MTNIQETYRNSKGLMTKQRHWRLDMKKAAENGTRLFKITAHIDISSLSSLAAPPLPLPYHAHPLCFVACLF